jgi:uncharacterized membrane protein
MVLGVARAIRRNRIALVFVVGLAVFYSTFAVERQLTFHTGGWDLGIFVQAIRNYSELKPPIVILKGPGFNLLGDHFHPILVLLAPFYALAPTAITLLVAQAVLFAVAAWPLVSWARTSLGRGPAVIVGLVYGLSFGIASAVGFDFHEIAFAVPLIAFSLSALGQQRLRAAAAWALPLVLVKEDLGLSVVAVIGVLIALRGARRLGIAVAVAGAAATALEMLVILPAVNASGGYDYWAKLSHHPVLEVLGMSAGEKLVTLALTIAVSGLVALRSPMVLVALPTLAWRFASDDANYWGTVYHYSAVLMPIMVAAMIDGLIRIRKRNRQSSRWIVPASLGVAVLFAAALLPSHSFAQFATAKFWQPNPETAAITNALSRIPDGATVSASDNLIPQLTSRASVTLFGLRPLASVRPQWIVVDANSTRHFVVTRAREQSDLLSAEAHGYRVAFSQNNITLLARTAG